jgi:hypothetical protein
MTAPRSLLAGALLALATIAAARPEERSNIDPRVALAAAIDAALRAEWDRAGLAPSAPADDMTWLRRLSLDLRGCAPLPAEIGAFLGEPAETRRAAAIDRFLGDPLFADHAAAIWSHLLVDEAGKDAEKTSRWLEPWLEERFAAGATLIELTRELVAGTGAARTPGGFAFTISFRDTPETLAGVTARAFLGLQIQCAQCHDHPYDTWKQEQFNRFTGFFLELRGDHGLLPEIGGPGFRVIDRSPEWDLADRLRKLEGAEGRAARNEKMRGGDDDEAIGAMAPDGDRGAAPARRTPAQKQALAELQKLCRETRPGVRAILEWRKDAAAVADLRSRLAPDALEPLDRYLDRCERFGVVGHLDGRECGSIEPGGRRAALADWMVAPENPWFARAQANRAFSWMLGKGLVAPVDDLTGSEDIVLPDLLEAASRAFMEQGGDLRFLLGALARTEAYALSATTPEGAEARTTAERRYAAHPRRGFTPEMLATTLLRATGGAESLPELESRRPALLRELARCAPRRADDHDRALESNLPLALLLMNGDDVGAPAALREAAAGGALAADAPPEQRLAPWFLATLSRLPASSEAAALAQGLTGVPGAAAGADLFWALVNCAEFRTNR